MSDKPNGGPAFPTTDFTHAGQIIPGSEGMTLRDWFAGLAMQGLLASPRTPSHSEGGLTTELIAWHAYAAADAMLKEREK